MPRSPIAVYRRSKDPETHSLQEQSGYRALVGECALFNPAVVLPVDKNSVTAGKNGIL